MTKQETKKWEGTPAKAVYVVSNTCSMEILDYEYGIHDCIIIKGFVGDIHKYRIHSSRKGYYFTYCNGCRYYIKDFSVL